MVKLLMWNVRGVQKKSAIAHIKNLKRVHHFKFLGICEPKIPTSSLDDIKLKLGFEHAISNTSSRIWVFWSGLIQYSIASDSDQEISIHITSGLGIPPCLLTFVYGRHSRVD